MTLLDIVQNIMSSMSLEEVNSIEDVPESLQIATIVQETYYEITAHREWEFLRKTFSMEASGSSLKPVAMKIPSNISDIEIVKYLDEKDGKYKEVSYMAPELFLEELSERNLGVSIDNLEGMLKQANIALRVFNDRQPKYYTSFDENTLIFDSYNKEYDNTLQESKTLAYGTEIIPFEVADDFVIPFPKEMIWSYLLPEAKSTANVNILQTVNAKEEQKSRRGRFRMYHAHPKTTNDFRREVAKFGRK